MRRRTGTRRTDRSLWLLALCAVLSAAGATAITAAATAAAAGGAPVGSEDSDAARFPRLCVLRSDSADLDQTALDGLKGLTALLTRRTAVRLAGPLLLEVGDSRLPLCPLLYWSPSRLSPPLQAGAAARLDGYLHHGGLLIVDSPEIARTAARLLAGLDVPPLEPLTADHVLSRSYYLLQDWPGSQPGGPVLVARGTAALPPPSARTTDSNAGEKAAPLPLSVPVSPLLLGDRGWAAAWATDAQGRPLFPVLPGGEAQREQAFRFGVNLVHYALTGTYKADQVHVRGLLDRMARP